jgi:N-acylneuraminate cytidylyltransferase
VSQEILAVIPISGLDEEFRDDIPRLAGRPLPDYTFDAVRESRFVTRSIVATDTEMVANYARCSGLEAPFLRPAWLAQRSIPDVFRFVLDWLKTHEGYEPDWVVHVQITHPLRRPGFIDDQIRTVFSQGLDSAFAALEEPHTFWYIDDEGEPQQIVSSHREMEGTRRPIYRQLSGLFSIARTSVVLGGSLTGQAVGIMPVRDLAESLDVRDKVWLPVVEWLIAQRIAGIRQHG